MSAASKILDRLDRPRQTRPGQWIAGCPCCQSRRGRPISLRETDDGRALLHAFCGCQTEDVLAALGLTLADLFEHPLGDHLAPSPLRLPARELLQLISFEADVAAIIALDILEVRDCSELAWARLARAAARIGKALHHVR